MDPTANIFLSLQTFEPLAREISAFEEMLGQFSAHERHEQEFLNDYRGIVDRHDNPLVKFLLQLIISDEEKHHEVVRTMTSALQTDLTGIRGGGADMPKLGALSEQEKDDLLDLTGEFIRAEAQTIKEYKALMKRSKGYHKGLLVLLIKTIIHDSEKHMMILEFIDEKLREA
ncbi:MAG: hypothetical protein HQ514_01030 [Rhodospirillales bacterium]|nr:hypothetical protein [Rhodospirillales bacterium]